MKWYKRGKKKAYCLGNVTKQVDQTWFLYWVEHKEVTVSEELIVRIYSHTIYLHMYWLYIYEYIVTLGN